jgi:hypothetical protein
MALPNERIDQAEESFEETDLGALWLRIQMVHR